jgi:hypothetical protein
MLADSKFEHISMYGSSGLGKGLWLQGGQNLEFSFIDIQGYAGAGGIPDNYLQYGLYTQNGYGGSAQTTTTFRKSYFHYCYTGASTQGYQHFEDSIFEANTIGLIILNESTVRLTNPWFEANISSDIYFDLETDTIIRGGRINSGDRQIFFTGYHPTLIILDGVHFVSDNISPILFDTVNAFDGCTLVIKNCVFPANTIIGGLNWAKVILEGNTNLSEINRLADSATPSVAVGNKFLTGGTTTITDLTDGYVGKIITMISEHAITITDGTNIFLAGSANFVMAATDTLTLIQKADGKWYELSRSVN